MKRIHLDRPKFRRQAFPARGAHARFAGPDVVRAKAVPSFRLSAAAGLRFASELVIGGEGHVITSAGTNQLMALVEQRLPDAERARLARAARIWIRRERTWTSKHE